MDSSDESEGWTFMLFLICTMVTMSTVLPIGYCFGVVNTPAGFIKKWLSETIKVRYDKDLNEGQVRMLMSVFVTIFVIGGIVGSTFGSKISEKFGRKGSLIIAAVLYVIGAVAMFFCRMAKLVELLMIGRFICGIAAALVYTSQPMYLVELAPTELSGSVGVFTCIGVTGGIVVGQIFSLKDVCGTEEHWHFAVAGFVIFVIVGSLPFIIFPESPRHIYMSKGDAAKTRAALSRLRRKEETVNAEMTQIEAQAKTSGDTLGIGAVLCDSNYCLPITVVCSFHVTQQLSGINAIFYYSIVVFLKAGFCVDTAEWLNFVLGIQNFLAAMAGPTLMSKLNRRFLMMCSCAFCCLFLIILTITLCFIDQHRFLAKICILCLTMYIVSFNLGLGSIPFFIGSELCTVPPRPSVMALGSFANWLSNFIIGMSFPELQASIKSFSFLPCALVCLYGFLLTWRYLPETRNRDAKDVAPLMTRGFKSKINEPVNSQ